MPIRKRVSDPSSTDSVKITKRIIERLSRPTKPGRPAYTADNKFLAVLKSVPYRQQFTPSAMRDLSIKMLREEFEVYGVKLQLYPVHKSVFKEDTESKEFTGLMVFMQHPKIPSQQLKLELKGLKQKWHRLIMDWIEANVYG